MPGGRSYGRRAIPKTGDAMNEELSIREMIDLDHKVIIAEREKLQFISIQTRHLRALLAIVDAYEKSKPTTN
jgi:hypothetical protein